MHGAALYLCDCTLRSDIKDMLLHGRAWEGEALVRCNLVPGIPVERLHVCDNTIPADNCSHRLVWPHVLPQALGAVCPEPLIEGVYIQVHWVSPYSVLHKALCKHH